VNIWCKEYAAPFTAPPDERKRQPKEAGKGVVQFALPGPQSRRVPRARPEDDDQGEGLPGVELASEVDADVSDRCAG
jgi:hypothetical protein